MKILLAVDFSQIGREVAFRGYHYAQQLGAEVTFLHVVSAISNFVESYNLHFFITPEARSTEAKVKEAARVQLRHLIDDVRGHYSDMPEPRWDERVEVAGSPGSEIIRISEAEHYDVIIIGNKGYSTVERVLLGSTALKVINSAKCSVWLYRHTDYVTHEAPADEPLSEKIWDNKDPLPSI